MIKNEHTLTKKENQKTTYNLPIDSKSLLGQSSYLDIAHEGEIYRLRITKLKKLIFTK